MKKLFCSLVLAVALLSGCSGSSSMAEAIAVVQGLDDCKEVIQSLSIESSLAKASVSISDSTPKLKEQDTVNYSNHIVIYRTKTETFRLATIDSSRPPKVTALSTEFK